MGTKRRLLIIASGFVAIFIMIGIQKLEYMTSLWSIFDPVSYDDNKFHTSKNFRCNGKWMEEYSRYHANSLQSRSNDRKFLIYYCAGSKHHGCGGYGNRMVSIVSLFYLAVVLNRTFMIHWGGPALLETYLQPHRIDWRYNELPFQGLKSIKRYWGMDRIPGYENYFIVREKNFLHWTQVANFRLILSHQVEKVSTIWYFAEKMWDNPHTKTIAKNLGIPTRSNEYPKAMIGCAMSYLFKKSKALMKEFSKVKSVLQDRPRPFIGMHIRSSDYQFGSNNPHSVRTRDISRVFACAEKVEKALKGKFFSIRQKNITWILAADSKDIKDKAVKSYPKKMVTLDIVPHHLDITKSGQQNILRDLLIDQMLLLESDYFILTSQSTFSLIIAGLRQFSLHSITYGESCQINERKIILAQSN